MDGTRLLSNGPERFVTSSIGTIQLPFSGVGSDLTALPASIVGNVAVANNTELSGFGITGGVTGAGVMSVNVNTIAVDSAPADAVSFTASDAISLNDIAISSPTGRGILLDDTTATVSNVTIADAGDDGIQIDSAATDRAVSITSTTITNAGNEGLDVNVRGAGNLVLDVTSSSITATNNAFDITTTAGGDALLSLSGTTLESSAGAGLNADGSAGAGTVFIHGLSNTTVTDAMTGGLLFDTVTFDGDPATAGIQTLTSGTTIVGSAGNRVTGRGVSLKDVTGDWDVGNLTIFNQIGTGLFADNSALGTPVTLTSTAGSILNTQAGPALEMNTVTSALNFSSITSANSPTLAMSVTSSTGSLNSSTTTFSGSVFPSIRYETIALPDLFTPDTGITTINSTISNAKADNIKKFGITTGVMDEPYTSLTINGP